MKNENIMIKLLYIYNIYVQQILQHEERMEQIMQHFLLTH